MLPSAAAEYPFCDQPDREVYIARGKLDEVASSTVLGPCSVMAASEASAESLQSFLEQPDTYFYRYEYSPKRPPLFSLPGGQPFWWLTLAGLGRPRQTHVMYDLLGISQ